MNDILIIIPSYDPDEHLTKTINSLYEVGFNNFLLVDDGSDAAHKKPFSDAMAEHPEVKLITHSANMGKGRALRDAFAYAAEISGIIGAITVDGDGQHRPSDVLKVANELRTRADATPDATHTMPSYDANELRTRADATPCPLILGCRNFDLPQVPSKSRSGNKITSRIFKILFGLDISDTQTGLRGVAREYFKTFSEDIEGERFEYETTMLIYAYNKGIPFLEIPIETVYEDANSRTHYRPVLDALRVGRAIYRNAMVAKQIVSSTVCSIVDLGLFKLFDFLFRNAALLLRIFGATVIARICSAVLNYTINRNYVFKSHASVGLSGVKYFIVAVCQVTLSWLFVTGIVKLTGAAGLTRVVVKICVDVFLWVTSYLVQKKWVFK